MSTAAQEDLERYVFTKTDDPDVRARQRMIAEWALEASPRRSLLPASPSRSGSRPSFSLRRRARADHRSAVSAFTSSGFTTLPSALRGREETTFTSRGTL